VDAVEVSAILVPLLAFLAGALIGAVGVGGVVLVSGLIYLAGVEAPVAIAACMMGYILTGAVGTWAYARKGAIRWPSAAWLSAGALPSAFFGAMATNTVSPAALELGIGLVTAGGGLHALLAAKPASENVAMAGAAPLTIIGAMVGFGSAITGTGGPLLLVPILLALRAPVLAAVGLSQAIQIPIAAVATLGNAVYGALDLRLGAVLAVALAAGTWMGARIAHRAPQAVLRRLVAMLVVAIGTLILLRLAVRQLA